MNTYTFLKTDYKKNVRDFSLEEPFDFLVFRPIAYVLIRLTYWLPLTPNHFSIMALFVAIASGYFLSTGTAMGSLYGGIGIFIFSVFDCCDGMLARMKKNGSPLGTLIDMFVDLIANIFFFVGLAMGLSTTDGFFPIQYLAIISGVFILIHASIYHFYKKQYLFYMENNPEGRNREIEQYQRELEKLNKKGGSYFSRLLISLFLFFSKNQKAKDKVKNYDVKSYLKFNRHILPLWGIAAGSTHLFILSISLMSHRIGIYLLTANILLNLWLIFVFTIQLGVNGNLQEVQ